MRWKTRAQRDTTDVARRRIWSEHGGEYRVVESVYLFGSLPTRYYAQRLAPYGQRRCWINLSTHRRRARAVLACERAARKNAVRNANSEVS